MLQTVFFEKTEKNSLSNIFDLNLKVDYKINDEKKEIVGFHIQLDLNTLEEKYIKKEKISSIELFFLLLFSNNENILNELKELDEFYQSVFVVRNEIINRLQQMTKQYQQMMNS